ncbi:beta-glucosidase 24-like [Phalaenopsis equestris]|uniref:beta-glucosidase 24-like n=1 Tax=Phalaenopsis equestris TaxID=78828 RepID=UPI0009E2078D|nr:beta-glucosidase 24-like [Phalaenopsis equestris]
MKKVKQELTLRFLLLCLLRGTLASGNSLLRKPRVWKVVSPVSSTGSTRNYLVVKGLINDNVALYEEEIESFSSLDHKPHNIFPPDFVFGAASSAFQVEGATKAGGRGPSIWDTFCERSPGPSWACQRLSNTRGKIADRSSGDPGAGSYYRYKEDVQLLVDIGLQAYRFSISWPRVLPKGRGLPNQEGLKYYHNLIDELKLHVKHSITMNEPLMFASQGYGLGRLAPGHCTPDIEIPGFGPLNCPVGDSLREPYKVAHNLLLAHAEAVDLYKTHYQAKQRGKVGITINSHWYEPYDESPLNKEAQQRVLDFNVGWFLDPVKFGNYPFSMRALVGDRLPIFTDEESAKLRESYDFIGVNYYTSRYVKDKPYNYTIKPQTCNDDVQADTPGTSTVWFALRCQMHDMMRSTSPFAHPNTQFYVFTSLTHKSSYLPAYHLITSITSKLSLIFTDICLIAKRAGVPIGPAKPKSWVNVYPKGLRHIKRRYNNPAIYITENGVLAYNDDGVNIPTEDIFRTEFLTSHLHELEDALSSRANVKGYFVWSLLDNFEWRDGYTCRFVLNHINYDNLHEPDLRRTPKQSSRWLKRYLRNINNTKPTVLPAPIISELVKPVVATKT